MIPFSILDLAPVTEGSNAAQAFRNTLDLAQLGERLGYRRYWLAEHHNMPGIASAAPASGRSAPCARMLFAPIDIRAFAHRVRSPTGLS